MATAKQRDAVGVIGLGIMGGAFARNLAAAGWRVIGFDISKPRCREAARGRRGDRQGRRRVAAEAPTIITSLPKPQALAMTVQAHRRRRAAPRRVVIEASTFALEDKHAAEKALRAAGHVALDCPVSGTGAQAKTKDLVIYASGDRQAIAKLQPMFADFSRQAHDLGEYGNGSNMKYVANLLVAIHNVASAEAMVLGIKAGLDPKKIFELAHRRRRQFARVGIARPHDGRRTAMATPP